tara:strand:+ start:2194 stop:2919 length:726 start_codon:yes stop_codon:yes gene_type:complete
MNTWNNAFGKVLMKNFFSHEDMISIKKMVFDLTHEPDRKDYIWKFYESDNTTVNRIEYFVNHHTGLRDLANSEKIMEVVNELMGDESVLFKDKINYKYPGGEGFQPHQDITAGWGNYTNKHVSFALPLCDTNDDNGGIYFGETVTEQLTPNFTDLDMKLDYTLVPTTLGDAIFFDSYVPHASYDNRTEDPRPFLFFTYTPKCAGNFYEQYHADKFKNVPPDIYKEKGKSYRSGNSNVEKVF